MILSVDKISMRFGGLKALDNVSLGIEKGTITGLIGPNGSGKTTLFNIISGYYPPTSGKVFFKGKDVTRDKPYVLARQGLSRTFQGTLLFNDRTVLENIVIALYCGKARLWLRPLYSSAAIARTERADLRSAERILETVGIQKYGREKVSSIPFGIRHLLEIGRCIALDPDLILLDEPTTGLNSAEQDEIMVLIKRLRHDGMTVLIVEHNMKVIMNSCEEIIVLDMGIKIADGTKEEVRSDKRVIESYLGREVRNA